MASTTLPPKGFFGATSEFETRDWTALEVPEDVQFSDLFDPSFWRHHATKFKPGHLIRMRRVDGAWDVQLNVVATAAGFVQVEIWPKMPTAADLKAAEAEKSRPLEEGTVDFTPATKWRVIGSGGQEISRGHKNKADAERALETHLAAVGRKRAVA